MDKILFKFYGDDYPHDTEMDRIHKMTDDFTTRMTKIYMEREAMEKEINDLLLMVVPAESDKDEDGDIHKVVDQPLFWKTEQIRTALYEAGYHPKTIE